MSETAQKSGASKFLPYALLLGAFAVLIAVGIVTS